MIPVRGFQGKTVAVSGGVTDEGDQIADLKALVADLNSGKVDWLVILNSNPVYDAPADLDFKTALNKAKVSVHLARTFEGKNAVDGSNATCWRADEKDISPWWQLDLGEIHHG